MHRIEHSSPGGDDQAVFLDFAKQMRTHAIRDRLDELGFEGTAGDMVVVCPPGRPLQPSTSDVPEGAGRVLYVTQDDSELGWAMTWAIVEGDPRASGATPPA